MKRSSHRRAIRWIMQEMTRWLEQHNDPLRDQTRSHACEQRHCSQYQWEPKRNGPVAGRQARNDP
jgi:hypothetical protein